MPVESDDLEWHSWPIIRPGGQHTNGPMSAGVLVVHIPTGIGAISVDERSLYKNKLKAVEKLEMYLETYDFYHRDNEEEDGVG